MPAFMIDAGAQCYRIHSVRFGVQFIAGDVFREMPAFLRANDPVALADNGRLDFDSIRKGPE